MRPRSSLVRQRRFGKNLPRQTLVSYTDDGDKRSLLNVCACLPNNTVSLFRQP